MQKHSSNVVYTLQSKLATVHKDFKHVLEVRSEVSTLFKNINFSIIVTIKLNGLIK
jgi:hypothetical protein